MQFSSMSDAIGATPLIRLQNFEKEYGLECKLFAKFEGVNPTGSAKDRAAIGMIRDAEIKGEIKPGDTVIEPTSGNTGIALAAISASRGYKCIIVMPDSMSKERIKLMETYGAQVVLTPGAGGMKAAIQKAEEIQKNTPGSKIMGQFYNPANPREHYRTTGPEIYKDLGGKVDYFVAGIGTGGTFTGVSSFLKEVLEDVKCIAVEPASSPVLSQGADKASGHKIQGIGANFVPDNFNRKYLDEIITVTNEDALELFAKIPKTEGLLVGISSGAALCAALEVAKRDGMKGKNVVVVFTDSGDRYLA